MGQFYELAEKEIPNFGGIYYADYNLEFAVETLKTDNTIILGVGKVHVAPFTLGFHAISSTAMNIFPEMIFELYNHIVNKQVKEALVVQDKLIKCIFDVATLEEDFIVKMKVEFNKLNLGFKLGATRKPFCTESMTHHY